jgi:NADPH-dependent glutamate synthase beta subunit-like oxidoreductase/Pyruvate/2-oxoacid:ferredoxin oxidoreductase gamma subunit/Pyruvate/2-oxoacid:ferredoxin oxidoreductase delta subunit
LTYASLGLYAQTFGDYGMERAGAPVRAYTRVDRNPIKNRNKVYTPHHLLILDPSLFGEGVLDGALPGSLILLNTPEDISSFRGVCEQFRFATAHATDIARKRGIGASSVVIVNTAITGAYARLVDLPISAIEATFSTLGLHDDLGAALDAYHAVTVREPTVQDDSSRAVCSAAPKSPAQVIALTDLTYDMPTPLKTGSWRTQSPLYRVKEAPCNAACPAGNDVIGFIRALEQDGIRAAAQALIRTQPLPSVCGRVCPAPCMASCNRATYDGAVNIRGLERWVADHMVEAPIDIQPCANPKTVAVVGGGPAGLSAAFVLARDGHDVTIFDSNAEPGGLLRTAIPYYRLPREALDRDIGRIIGLGTKFKRRESVNAQRIQDLSFSHDAVILATGQAFTGTLDIPGANLQGVEQGLSLLNRVKAQGTEELHGAVVVIGGGNTGVDCARTALRCGASKVFLVYRRGREEMPAIKEEIEEALAEGVEALLCRQPVAFVGEGRVKEIQLAEVELGAPDPSGRRRPIATNRVSALSCNYVFAALGQSSDLGILPPEWIMREGRCYLRGQPLNVWAAGDLSTAAGTVAHAVGDGKKVAHEVLKYFNGALFVDTGVVSAQPQLVSPDEIRFSRFASIGRNNDIHLPVRSRLSGFQEVSSGLSNYSEAGRCFSCGHCTRCDTCLTFCPEGIIVRQGEEYAIDGEYCKGCGICAWECPRNAMQMTAQGYRSQP